MKKTQNTSMNGRHQNSCRDSSINATMIDHTDYGNKFRTSSIVSSMKHKSSSSSNHDTKLMRNADINTTTINSADRSSVSSETFIEPNAIIFDDSDIIVNNIDVALMAPSTWDYNNQDLLAITNNNTSKNINEWTYSNYKNQKYSNNDGNGKRDSIQSINSLTRHTRDRDCNSYRDGQFTSHERDQIGIQSEALMAVDKLKKLSKDEIIDKLLKMYKENSKLRQTIDTKDEIIVDLKKGHTALNQAMYYKQQELDDLRNEYDKFKVKIQQRNNKPDTRRDHNANNNIDDNEREHDRQHMIQTSNASDIVNMDAHGLDDICNKNSIPALSQNQPQSGSKHTPHVHSQEYKETIDICAARNENNSNSNAIKNVTQPSSNVNDNDGMIASTRTYTLLSEILLNMDNITLCINNFKSLHTFCCPDASNTACDDIKLLLLQYNNGKGLDVIIKTMTKYQKDEHIVQYGMQLLNEFASADITSTFASSIIDTSLHSNSLIKMIADAIILHDKNINVVESGLSLLKKISREMVIKTEGSDPVFSGQKRLIYKIYQAARNCVKKYTKPNYQPIVLDACLIFANIAIIDKHQSLKMVRSGLIDDLLSVNELIKIESFVLPDIVRIREEIVRCLINVVLARGNVQHNDYTSEIIYVMEKSTVLSQLIIILKQFWHRWPRDGINLTQSCLDLLFKLLCMCNDDCHNDCNSINSMKVHLQLARNDIDLVLTSIIKSYRVAYKDNHFSPMEQPEKQKVMVDKVCDVLRTLAVNQCIVDQLEKNDIVTELAQTYQLHDDKMRMINKKHYHGSLGYRIKHSDIVLLSDKEFTQNVSATLYQFINSEWNYMIRYIWIGFYKNDQKCLISLLPQDIVKYMIQFLRNDGIYKQH